MTISKEMQDAIELLVKKSESAPDDPVAESLLAFADLWRAPLNSPERDAAARRIGEIGARMTVEQALRCRKILMAMGNNIAGPESMQ